MEFGKETILREEKPGGSSDVCQPMPPSDRRRCPKTATAQRPAQQQMLWRRTVHDVLSPHVLLRPNHPAGGVCVWCYAPGWLDNGQPSLEAMQQLTGFKLELQGNVPAWAAPLDGSLTQAFGLHQPVRPPFSVADATAGERLAKYMRMTAPPQPSVAARCSWALPD